MEDLQTYNRVNKLGNKRKQLLFIVLGIICIAITAALTASLLLLQLDNHYLIASGAAIATLIIAGFTLIKKSSAALKRCQFCSYELVTIERPFQFKNIHITSPGIKIDKQFFSEEIKQGQVQWLRHYQWSPGCHHCKLYETTYTESLKPASPEEVAKIRKKMAGKHKKKPVTQAA